MDTLLGYFLDAGSVTLVFYLLMRFFLGQSTSKALYRSVLLGALELVWVLLFGYNFLPKRLNPHLQ
jgi:hypothetical protein